MLRDERRRVKVMGGSLAVGGEELGFLEITEINIRSMYGCVFIMSVEGASSFKTKVSEGLTIVQQDTEVVLVESLLECL